eukprot:1179012-Prorocentrum_minimum.AAC.2
MFNYKRRGPNANTAPSDGQSPSSAERAHSPTPGSVPAGAPHKTHHNQACQNASPDYRVLYEELKSGLRS